MTPTTFRARLRTLGLTVRGFCALTGIATSTASYWGRDRDGSTPPFPGWVGRLLDAWEQIGTAPSP